MAPQDSFIDDDDNTCPLCVEDFDLSDKNFRPCPCGYQVCQFCYNNIKNNMNGLCPACRRPYDEKTIEWKVVTPEEYAQFNANIQKNAKKKAEQRQKEAQKREVESLNRKHLAGLRVIQKNLVYVVGLSPGIREDEILQTLRGDKYFGQYGKIIKIVVSKAKQGEVAQNGQSLGVYVTFARKEDAARCIAAVNGSQNGDRVLRAQLGTTKYCSAYLRSETCTNKQCMFLHEPGDNDDSYSRQDLSSINSVNTQRPFPAMASASSSRSAQTSLQQAQPVAAATQPMMREASRDGSEIGDGSALPSTASWANRGTQQRSRRGSHSTSHADSSPAVSHAMPATAETVEESSERQEHPEPENVSSPEPSADATPSESPRRERNIVLLNLLKSINSPLSPQIDTGGDESHYLFPPLFDDRGGEKRRAMREQQDENRLHIEQESQADVRSVAEPMEEEEPESGSLQLGGEPEDRDNGREGSQPQGFQRRPSSQLPIQRASNGAPFGPSLGQNFTQNLGNLSTINGRALTPMQQQQLLALKSGQPQTGFMDQYPGIGNSLGQGSLFQQQGHNRQSSRYSFANDGSSASSSVKPSANPKLMAQQSSMMPSGNHTQQSSQFYNSSMPGPPPGLKSTGTPPGGMFGQSHGFGGSMGGGSAFGGAPKENGSEMLRDMLRGRGGVGGQGHDSGKREYMFPSFLQQYPSASSTPAPASGLLASLYGPQTGAFHDFGQKQKKKGKKHRHANTSSSGGGGLVDLADPSILQARMQHQQQSNAGVGQGLFGGQAQDDIGLPSLDEASMSVDALVADDDKTPRSFDSFDFISRPSTPSVPPGFELPHAHPAPAIREDLTMKPPSRIVPTSAPFTPSRNTSSNFIPRAATPLAHVFVPSTPAQSPSTQKRATINLLAKQDVKALAADTGLSKTIASQANLHWEDFPALETKVASPIVTKTPLSTKSLASTVKKPSTTSSSSTSASQPSITVIDKRPAPGTLNITVPKMTGKLSSVQETPPKSAAAPSAFPPLPPTSSISIQSPLARNTPKTLRVVSTPKTETPTMGSATPSSTTSNFPPGFPTMRKPSLVSLSRQDRPGTPTSEIISDNASITSTSMSRASSPPPTKVGSAPVRTTTKSMQKKQRREAQKEKEKSELEAAAVKAEPEVEIAPIMGRKKKQKKEKVVNSVTGESTPAVSRPPSPGLAEIPRDEKDTRVQVVESSSQTAEKATPVEKDSNKSLAKLPDSKDKGKAKAQVQRSPAPEPVSMTEVEEEVAERPMPTPASILQDLIASGAILDAANLPVLRSLNYLKPEMPLDVQDASQKLSITQEERATLLSGLPVHKTTDVLSRVMFTPNGDCVRNLSPAEEERYLELQTRISEAAGPATFFTAKHHASNGFTLIGGRAVPNGPPAFFPLPNNRATTSMDPVSKIQRDEALSYINQYVLPSLSTNSQLEKALNANALDSEILRSTEPSTWPSWDSSHPDNNEPASGQSGQERILESITSQFAVGRNIDRGQPLANVSLLSLTEAESAMQIARKETEVLEKKLNALLKKNRRVLLGAGH
ncbi:hypothetical protein B7494_g5691 [Chlorociboria aeruginascens]|nr:hypothetical protein B7494_g5691 [Chlorociboria aeruginascens]